MHTFGYKKSYYFSDKQMPECTFSAHEHLCLLAILPDLKIYRHWIKRTEADRNLTTTF